MGVGLGGCRLGLGAPWGVLAAGEVGDDEVGGGRIGGGGVWGGGVVGDGVRGGVEGVEVEGVAMLCVGWQSRQSHCGGIGWF